MNLKAIVLVVGVLIIGQIAMLGYMYSGNVETINRSIGALDSQVRSVSAEKADLTKRMEGYRAAISAIPPELLAGFEDPEVGFVEFLDYLQSPIFQEIGAGVTMKAQSFRTTPIPLHETEFTFKYMFADTYDAERFVDYVVFQQRYPLQVNTFSAKRTNSGVVEGDMSVSLLIPAKLQLDIPPDAQMREGQ